MWADVQSGDAVSTVECHRFYDTIKSVVDARNTAVCRERLSDFPRPGCLAKHGMALGDVSVPWRW